MTTSSPDCTNRHRSGYTCLDMGRDMDDCCTACRTVASKRLLDAIFPDGVPERKSTLDEEPGDIGPKEVASFDLPSSSFPFDIVFVNKKTKEVWHEIHVTGPGVMDIPPGKQAGVTESEVIIRCADGTVIRSS